MAKRNIAKIADGIPFSDEQKGKIDIIVTELTSNLIKHSAVDGEILIRHIQEEHTEGIEIISADNGPGMHDTDRMMEDGVSTYGSKGEGLGAIKRLSDEFDIYSVPKVGTFILSRLFVKKSASSMVSSIIPRPTPSVRAIMVPKPGETTCGDGWAMVEHEQQLIILAADGLGHGVDAHQASDEAIEVFSTCIKCVPSEILKLIHSSIKHTRGMVGSIAKIDLKEQTITYCGIGNISGKLIAPDGQSSLISYNGTIGYNIPAHLNDHTYDWDTSGIMILHSDGVRTSWDLSRYPGIEKHDTAIFAAVIYKDNTRRSDDALVIVVEIKRIPNE